MPRSNDGLDPSLFEYLSRDCGVTADNPLYSYADHWIATPDYLEAGHNLVVPPPSLPEQLLQTPQPTVLAQQSQQAQQKQRPMTVDELKQTYNAAKGAVSSNSSSDGDWQSD